MNPSQSNSSRAPIRQQARTNPYHPKGSILAGITSTLELAEKALDNVPIPGAKAAIGSILLVVKRVDTSKKNSKKLQTLKRHVNQLCKDVLTPLCNADKDIQLPSDFVGDIESFAGELIVLASELECRSSRTGPRRIIGADDDRDDLTVLSDGIKNAVDGFVVKGTVAIQIDNARNLHNDRLRLVNDLPRACNANHESSRVNSISTCFENTRASVIGEITAWMHGDDNRSVFWLNGMAGIGKTTIARTIVEKSKDNEEILLASFFFSRDDAQASNSHLVFPTLAYQITRQNPITMQVLAEIIRGNPDCKDYSLKKQFSEFVIGPLKTPSQSRRTILFILDALDECSSKEDVSEILRLLLSNTSTIPYSLRILITSRPERHILSEFSKAQDHAKIVLHDIEKAIVNDDIEKFVRHKLEAVFAEKDLPPPEDMDIMRLVEKSNKLFIYAATTLRFIGDKDVNNPKGQLSIILDGRKEPDENPYSVVDTLYLQVLRKAVPQDSPSWKRIERRNERVSAAIVMLQEPLALAALAVFIDMSLTDTKSALDSLQSVIIAPASIEEAPRVFHPSFAEFMTDKERCTDSRFLVDIHKQNMLLGHRCLKLMIDLLRQNMAGIEDETVRNVDVADFEGRVKEALPSQLRYACLHWASHMMATEYADEACLSSLHEFTHGSLLNWMEAMSLLGDVPRAIMMMRDMHAWAIRMKLEDGVRELLYDGYRWLLQYGNRLMDRAQYVYYSAVLTMPRDSALYRAYEGVVRSSVRVVRGAWRKWTPVLSEIDVRSKSRCDTSQTGNLSLAVSPDERYFATAAKNCDIALWDAHTGIHIATLDHAGEIHSLEFLPDDQLASGNCSGELSLWGTVTGSRIRTVNAHSNEISILSASKSKLASGSKDKTVRVWDTATWECTSTFECDDEVESVALYPNSDRVATCTYWRLYVWDTATRQLIASESVSYANSVAVSNDGKWLAVASYKTISLYDTNTLDCIWSHDRQSDFVSFSRDSCQLVSANLFDDKAELFDAQIGSFVKSFKHDRVSSAVFSHDGTRVLSASDVTCRLWDLHLTEEELQEDGTIWSVRFSEDGSFLAVIREDTLEMWKISTWERRWSAPCEGLDVNFSPDGLRVLVEDYHENVHAYDVQSGNTLDEIDSMPTSMHDHVHTLTGEVGGIWQCCKCENSLLKNCEYWFTESDRWLWVVDDGVAMRLIHIPAEYDIRDFQGCDRYVVFNCINELLVLDTARESEVV